MDYPPQEVLKVPSSMPAVPESLSPLTCDDLGLLTEGEEASGQHLHHSVSSLDGYKSRNPWYLSLVPSFN